MTEQRLKELERTAEASGSAVAKELAQEVRRMNTAIAFPRIGVATFVVKGTEILLGRSKKLYNKIVIPGGKIEPFEKVNDAARREILEETGVSVLLQDVLFVSEIVEKPSEHRIVIYMMGQYVAGEPVAGDDLSKVFWADTRFLDKYQDDMTDLTVDAIYKFSVAVRSRSMARRVQ